MQFVVTSPVRHWQPAWEDFLRKHSGWAGEHAGAGPVYSLPEPAIEILSRKPHGSRPVMSDAAARAESHLHEICTTFGVAGVLDGMPLSYPYLTSPLPRLPDAELAALGWSARQRKSAEAASRKAETATSRLKGYVGWLLTEPAFLETRDEMAALWRQLHPDERPGFPLARPAPAFVSSGLRPALPTTAEFAQKLEAFLDRWGLMSLVTWNLPLPQGPLLPAPVDRHSPAMPKHGLHLVLPIHYPLTGTDDLLETIREQQQRLAEENGLPASMAGLRHFAAYSRMFEVAHWERVITDRYGRKPRPKGFVSRMEHAMMASLGIEAHHLKKLRTAISACRRGERHKVKWLR